MMKSDNGDLRRGCHVTRILFGDQDTAKKPSGEDGLPQGASTSLLANECLFSVFRTDLMFLASSMEEMEPPVSI